MAPILDGFVSNRCSKKTTKKWWCVIMEPLSNWIFSGTQKLFVVMLWLFLTNGRRHRKVHRDPQYLRGGENFAPWVMLYDSAAHVIQSCQTPACFHSTPSPRRVTFSSNSTCKPVNYSAAAADINRDSAQRNSEHDEKNTLSQTKTRLTLCAHALTWAYTHTETQKHSVSLRGACCCSLVSSEIFIPAADQVSSSSSRSLSGFSGSPGPPLASSLPES